MSDSGRFDILSRSESGLSYVRERRGGITRVLTESELQDFNDPPPCPECAEQFGCEHYNCAGEALLAESELDVVPAEYLAFAREYGVSRADMERLKSIVRDLEGEYQLQPGTSADMRLQELVLLLNESR